MNEPPFELMSCSWPQPILQIDERWISKPEWNAPLMPIRPEPYWEDMRGELCWTLNWRRFFKQGIVLGNPGMSGTMPGFSIIFRIKIRASGTLVVWADDGSIIRRNEKIIHEDRDAHAVVKSEIMVYEGEELEVAQWQLDWEWLWGAWLKRNEQEVPVTPTALLLPYLPAVQRRLEQPVGPALKIFTDGRASARAVVAIYSMILLGYAPQEVFLFGEYQWSEQERNLFNTTLPFAHIISHQDILSRLYTLGVPALATLAQQYWFVMKTCVSMLYPPQESCQMDDDVVILGPVDDALTAFASHDLVYNFDHNHGEGYKTTWGHRDELKTGNFNAGLYWMRNHNDSRWLAQRMLSGHLNPSIPWLWEQGFIAVTFANSTTFQLPRQRYLYPLFDGLPGGPLGYDYEHNPCGFASIHFGGIVDKPSDGMALTIMEQLLKRFKEA